MPIKLALKTKIRINGQEYNSPDEMPSEVRSLYEKALASRGIQVKTNSKIRFNGQSFNSLDEMPADVRTVYDSIMAAVDKNGDGIPDSLQKDGAAVEPTAPLLPPQDQVISASKTSPRLLVLGLTIILLLLVIGALLLAVLSRGG